MKCSDCRFLVPEKPDPFRKKSPHVFYHVFYRDGVGYMKHA